MLVFWQTIQNLENIKEADSSVEVPAAGKVNENILLRVKAHYYRTFGLLYSNKAKYSTMLLLKSDLHEL